MTDYFKQYICEGCENECKKFDVGDEATKQTVKKDVGMKEGNTFEGGSEMLRRG